MACSTVAFQVLLYRGALQFLLKTDNSDDDDILCFYVDSVLLTVYLYVVLATFTFVASFLPSCYCRFKEKLT